MNNMPRFLIPVIAGLAVLVFLVFTQLDSTKDKAAEDVANQVNSTASETTPADLAAKAEAKAAELAAKAEAEAVELAAKAEAEAVELAAKAEAEAAELAAKAEAKAAELAAKAEAEAVELAAKAEAEAAELAAKAEAEAKAADLAAKAEAEAAELAAKVEAEAAKLAAEAEAAELAAKAKAAALATADKSDASSATATVAGDSSIPQYVVKDGMVDKGTYNGYRRFHGSCHACHGQDAAGGSFAPSLVESLKTVDYELFRKTVTEGRMTTSATGTASAMPAFSNDPNIMKHLDDIYRYLAARADGLVGAGRPKKIPK